MKVFEIGHPDRGLAEVLHALVKQGVRTNSRNGPVLRFDTPVCLAYSHPRNRVVSSPIRDANPFFHLVETMWMFGGMQEIAPLLLFNKGMQQYSDDGTNLRGTAYGHRWRNYKWGDQLQRAVDALRANPDDRRVVLSMWDGEELGQQGKDFACNLQVVFSTRPHEGGHALDMTVTNRSNDLIYGAMGSNLFHFSMLLEYVALHTGLTMGHYYQVSANLHLYTENPTSARCLELRDKLEGVAGATGDDYALTQLGLGLEMAPLREYVTTLNPAAALQPYLREVVMPLVEAYKVYKLPLATGLPISMEARKQLAMELAHNATASHQLRFACADWLARRGAKQGAVA